MTPQQQAAMRQALKKAFDLGKRYWSWADSEYSSHWKKADVAKEEFDQLIESTIAALEQQPSDEPVANTSAWFALVMNAAAELEDASHCLRDEDAKRTAISGAKHYRDAENALYTRPQPAAQLEADIPLTMNCTKCGAIGEATLTIAQTSDLVAPVVVTPTMVQAFLSACGRHYPWGGSDPAIEDGIRAAIEAAHGITGEQA